MQNQLKTLFFQEQPIYYLEAADGTNLVLIRPLCEALGVDADWQIRELKADEMLGPKVCSNTTQVPSDSQSRSWVCLPEKFIYGWLFAIQLSGAMKPETKAALTTYKLACYEILYNHFHGRIKAVLNLEKEQALVSVELEAVEKRLYAKVQDDPDYHRKVELQTKQKLLRKAETQSRRHSRQQAIEFAAGVLEPAEA